MNFLRFSVHQSSWVLESLFLKKKKKKKNGHSPKSLLRFPYWFGPSRLGILIYFVNKKLNRNVYLKSHWKNIYRNSKNCLLQWLILSSVFFHSRLSSSRAGREREASSRQPKVNQSSDGPFLVCYNILSLTQTVCLTNYNILTRTSCLEIEWIFY